MYRRMRWDEMKLTRERRPLQEGAATAARERGDSSLPEQTPVVGDHVRYIVREVEVSPMSALGYA